MSKIDILFDNVDYNINEESLSPYVSKIESHLSNVMNGSGSTVDFGGNSYNIDSEKLSTSMDNLVSHIGTIGGNGCKVIINGVQYGIDTTKLSDAVEEIHVVLRGLLDIDNGSGGDNGGESSVLGYGYVPFVADNTTWNGEYYDDFTQFNYDNSQITDVRISDYNGDEMNQYRCFVNNQEYPAYAIYDEFDDSMCGIVVELDDNTLYINYSPDTNTWYMEGDNMISEMLFTLESLISVNYTPLFDDGTWTGETVDGDPDDSGYYGGVYINRTDINYTESPYNVYQVTVNGTPYNCYRMENGSDGYRFYSNELETDLLYFDASDFESYGTCSWSTSLSYVVNDKYFTLKVDAITPA